jgi:hypothetical protein
VPRDIAYHCSQIEQGIELVVKLCVHAVELGQHRLGTWVTHASTNHFYLLCEFLGCALGDLLKRVTELPGEAEERLARYRS